MKNIKGAIEHFKTHQSYPASKSDLVKTCNELSDFSSEDKKWFEENLPEGKYNSAHDVMKALGLQKELKDMDQMHSATI